ncbi:hypothetical protein ACCT03_00070 [Rhizobium johnstonii]|uniref:hypothetical protein n=1 Tax=Rhizobium TaxID=379 RepID=UPI0010302F08|nr:hypothetical protein [Rhizobium leguminosarum]TBF83157.1 hypothetical protein ELG86_13955 [Rhizobium leguminosarum]TBG92597.1 hypothetical protein ELG70_38925 [Rhizobium leguminosarum]TBH12053.1 hypothetical protein ELG68_13355 [Rhizobium leguminosarum]TBH37103.1 hypothetical protein ELG66_15305 [Rhizobium leguminosarum]TBH62264.1 hypothetical protein ELG61_39060 [Rhizobium leguminosarum]
MRPDPANAEETVKVLEANDRLKRVWIVQRSDGVYVLRPEEWYQDVFEGEIVAEGWKPIYSNFGLFGSADLAESEAMASFEWLVHSPRKNA